MFIRAVSRFLLLVLCASSVGCATAGTRWLGARYTYSNTYQRTDNVVQSVHPDAANLKPGMTVAFYPPDTCFDTDATPQGEVQLREYIQLRCGVLLSELERVTAATGLRVVSWQLLRPFAGSSPLELARQLQVDVLFEVNELAINAGRNAKDRAATVEFFHQTSIDERKTIKIKGVSIVAARCDGQLEELGAGPRRRPSASLAVKMVSVDTGRALWFYRRTLGQDTDDSDGTLDLWYAAEPDDSKAKALRSFGIPMLAVGLPLAIIGTPILFSGNPYAGAPMTGTGVGLSLTGLFSLLGAEKAAREPDYPRPHEVLCVGTPRDINPLIDRRAQREEARDESGSSWTFSRSEASSAEGQNLESELIEKIVGDFARELHAL